MKVSLIMALILAILMAFFAIQNAQQTQVSFMGWYFNGPLVIVLLLSFTVGATAAFLAMLPGIVRKSLEVSTLKARLLELQQRVALLEKKPAGTGQQVHDESTQQTGTIPL